MGIPKPPYDPEMAAFLAVYPAPKDLTVDLIPALRSAAPSAETAASVSAGQPFTYKDHTVKTPQGVEIALTIFYPTSSSPSSSTPATTNGSGKALLPIMFYTHGGGMICGNRFTSCQEPLHYAKSSGAAVVTVEYRLAPEHPYPIPLEDCWAGLAWTAENAEALGLDREKLMLVGSSAGANLAAALALRARDSNGPRIAGMLIDCPMLDDRNDSLSARQTVSEGTWSKASNDMAWEQYLGKGVPGSAGVSEYAAPARTRDFGNLPTAFIGVGSNEAFRDESIAFANELWKAGVQCELHVWPGVFHLFDNLMPQHELSKTSLDVKAKWARRVFFPAQVKAKL